MSDTLRGDVQGSAGSGLAGSHLSGAVQRDPGILSGETQQVEALIGGGVIVFPEVISGQVATRIEDQIVILGTGPDGEELPIQVDQHGRLKLSIDGLQNRIETLVAQGYEAGIQMGLITNREPDYDERLNEEDE